MVSCVWVCQLISSGCSCWSRRGFLWILLEAMGVGCLRVFDCSELRMFGWLLCVFGLGAWLGGVSLLHVCGSKGLWHGFPGCSGGYVCVRSLPMVSVCSSRRRPCVIGEAAVAVRIFLRECVCRLMHVGMSVLIVDVRGCFAGSEFGTIAIRYVFFLV